MHLQIRSRLATEDSSGGPGAQWVGEVPGPVTTVTAGRLLRLLELLAADERPTGGSGPFNVIAAAGSSIETGGEFVFVVDAGPDHDEEGAHQAALARIAAEFPQSRVHRRIHDDLRDEPGALREFIAAHTRNGELVDEIVVGVARTVSDPGHAGTEAMVVPVQLSLVQAAS